MKKRIAIVGAGAAGMMAACAAAKAGCQVTVYEKNEKPGKKIYITGKGRCNLTNACERTDFFENVVRNPRFLYSAFFRFDNRSVMDFFEAQGCRLKVERGNRVFPVSDHASDVTRALVDAMQKAGVLLQTRCEGRRILQDADGAVCGLELSDGRKIEADAVILATGGLSYPSTGSTGDGMKMAGKLGHEIVSCSPALAPFETQQDWCRQLQGLTLKNVELSLMQGKKERYRGRGEMLFTHFGVSGPLVLTASSYLDGAGQKTAALSLNLKPALNREQLDRRLLRDFEEQKNRRFKNALGGLFPARLIPVMTALSGIDPETKVNEITRQQRLNFVSLIRELPITVTGIRGFTEAIITRGGVSVREVNPSTMESRRVKGLYFAGELLDVDALTGGFNLQIAWSTGRLAGESAADANKEGEKKP